MSEKSAIALLLVIVLVPFTRSAYGEILVLKNGREIQCSQVWAEGGTIKCALIGSVVGYPAEDVEKVLVDKTPAADYDGFTFDMWHSGMSIGEVMDAAESNDVPLHRQGLISANKHFNPEISRKYAQTANEFYYNDQLMGKPAVITLYFTPKSRLLFKVKIHLHGIDIKRNSLYSDEIAAMLSAKYGKPSRPTSKGLFSDTLSWRKTTFEVLMETGSGRIDIIYSDLKLQTVNSRELATLNAEERRLYHKQDASKF